MKQLLSSNDTSTLAVSHSSGTISTGFQWMVGKWRLFWNYCPECNSCAPKIHSCDVCNCDTKSLFHWNKEIENTWWRKYMQKHGIRMAN